MVHSRKKKLTPLRIKFDEVAYGAVKEYARRNSLSQSLLSQILSGKVTAENGGVGSMKIFKCLKRDGIWEDEFFPWDGEYKEAQAQKSA
jgi:hypothetical protein